MPTMKHGNELVWCRERLSKFCVGNGCDLGFGRAPINRTAICIDREEGHPDRAPTQPGDPPTHFCGDVRNLPFKDGVLDYVFSSHCLEDFPNTQEVLREWIRVIKPGGLLVLFLPDQQRYVKFCQENDELPNGAHKIPNFSLEWVKECAKNLGVVPIYELNDVPGNCHSFDLVFRKL